MVKRWLETRTKKRLFVVALAILTLWPLVHYALARRYHLDHWRFSGFAMYARPPYAPQVQFAGAVIDGRALSQDELRRSLGPEAHRVDDFIAARKLWGELESPEAVGRVILERLPRLPELSITVITVGLEPDADYLSFRARTYHCTRPGTRPGAPGPPVCR